MFIELRKLSAEGHRQLIEDEVAYLTNKLLHGEDGKDCVRYAAEYADAYVYDFEADPIDAHLSSGEEITDRAAEAIVRRLAATSSVVEHAHFNGWLRVFGFEELKRK